MGDTAGVSGGRYAATAIALHWLTAVLIVALIALGATIAGLPTSPTRLKLINWHKWAGICALALTCMRLAWRAAHAPPPPPPLPTWQRVAAATVHRLLLVLCVVVPVLGWAYSSAAGFPVVVFGVLPLPDWVGADRALAEAIKPWHGRAAWLLAVLAGLHATAAIKHHAWDRDGLLWRMAPWRP